MVEAPPNISVDRPDPATRRRTWLKRAGIGLLAFCSIFYGAGGWYFSSQLGNDACKSSFDVREALVAGSVGSAPRENGLDSPLALCRYFRAERDLRRDHAVDDHGARRLRVASRKMLSDARTVGNAVKIKRGITKRNTRRLKVRNRDAGCEIAGIVRELFEALTDELDGILERVLIFEQDGIVIYHAIHA